MKVGDLISYSDKELGLIVEINPLHRDDLYEPDCVNEVVILRPDGQKWYIVPQSWEVISGV